MPIAEIDQVRFQMGGRSQTTVSDASVIKAISFSDAFCVTATNFGPWTGTEPDFPVVKQASELIASSVLRARFRDEQDEAEDQKKWGESLLRAVKDNIALSLQEGEIEGGVAIESGVYETFPLNPSAPYRGREGRFPSPEVEGGTLDLWFSY